MDESVTTPPPQASARPRRSHPLVRIARSRDFLRDIIVTTLGVLIALGIGAIVEDIRWRLRLAAVNDVMNSELSLVRGNYAYQLLGQRCAWTKLSGLSDLIAAARKTHRLPDVGQIGSTRDFGEFGDSWTLAQNSDALLHMPPTEAMTLASRWVNVRFASQQIAKGREAWQGLAALESRPGPITDDLLDEADANLIRVATTSSSIFAIANKGDAEFARLGIPRREVSGRPFDVAAIKAEVAGSALCRPLLVDGKAFHGSAPLPPVELPPDLR